MKPVLVLLALGFAAAASAEIPASVQIDRDVAVPMRDSVVLRADVYRPVGEGKFPVLVFRTPYGKHYTAQSDGVYMKAVARGYAVVLQDVRGRYASGGIFDPYRQEGADGYDTIEWAARQSWSDGRVGTYGLSYPGAVQWLAAMEQPPHLVAMAPAMTFSSPRRFFYMGGIFDRAWLPWIYQNVAPDARKRLGMPDEGDADENWKKVASQYESFLPLRDLPWLRKEAPYYFEWLAHPPEDPWWDWAEVRGNYGKVTAAVLNFSGWYDDAYGVEGAATNFSGLLSNDARRTMDRGAPAPRTHLVLGPWDHGVPSVSDGRVGDLDFGPNAVIDYDGLILDFHDHYVRGIANRFESEPRVRYFVMGANEWRQADGWPIDRRGFRTLLLGKGAEGNLGRLTRAPHKAPYGVSVIRADPANPVKDPYDTPGPHDYSGLSSREDVLSFETDPLGEDLTIGPEFGGVIYASCDCRDFDLWVRLLDVYPDGRAFNVSSVGNGVVRASQQPGDCDDSPRPLEPGRRYALTFSNGLAAIRFGRGHRIRVQISTSFDPHLSRNLQTGESEIVSSKYQVASISIHYGPGQESRLVLPVLEGETDPTPVMQ
jgi:putative CocE/NonD family hydrolase